MSDIVNVDISNAAQWFLEINEQNDYIWSKDFPSMASPWPLARYTWREPKRININGRLIDSPMFGLWHEVIIVQGEIDPDHFYDGSFINELPAFRAQLMAGQKAIPLPPGFMSEYQTRYVDYAVANDMTCKWIQLITYRNQAPDIFGEATWTQFLDSRGRFIGGEESGPLLFIGSKFLVTADAAAVLYPVMFAISLLHCRNIELRDRPISRQQRRMAERTGKPVITYKELVIDAFRSQVRHETDAAGGNEIKRALHICRGHFATYTDANPLFGRVTGTFWRPMHVRGTKEAGEVRKTYQVRGKK